MGVKNEGKGAAGNPPGEDDKDPKDLPGEGEGGEGGEGNEGEGDPGGSNEPKFSDEQKAYIQKLRKESSGYRQKAKGLESKLTALTEKVSKLEGGIKKAIGIEGEGEADPEKLKGTIADKDAQIVQLQSQLGLMQAADEYGIPSKGRKYFATLVADAADSLEEGEEITEEQMADIVTEVKSLFGKAANSSINDDDGKGGGGKPPAGGDKITVEKFAKMTTTEKSVLYQKNPDLYKDLFQQAKDKRMLI